MKSRTIEQMNRHPKRNRGLIATIPLVALIAASAYANAQAKDGIATAQWNVMVIPGNQTAFSGQARELFDKRCASCHSKDGRAQTPIARQHRVRDLSESRLTDDVIVEQILEGTHNKANTFKMPPFKEKLSRAEIESLVPVVKAFRPASPEKENQIAASPRLAGIINFPNRKSAIIEKVANSGRYFVLRVDESHDGIELSKIMPDQGAVRLRVSGQRSPVTLKLDRQLMPSGRAKQPGFLRRLFDSISGDHHSLALDNANTDLVLFLYAQLTRCTLLRSPHLPAANFSLNATAKSKTPITISLQRVLAEKGIIVIPDGKKFLHVVPDADYPAVRPRSSEIKSLVSENGRSVSFPGGAFINLPDAELSQVVKLYTDLTGRSLDRTHRLPSNRGVSFTTQTALRVEECAYALETLLRWQGLRVGPAGGEPLKLGGVLGAESDLAR